MDPLQQLLDRVRPSTEAESLWLKNIFTFISEHLSPVVCSSAPSQTGMHSELGLFDLSMCLVQVIQQQMRVAHSLPVSYRLLSISELVSQQHLACVSNLSWSTNQQRAWATEAELALPGQRVLPRVNLLLIGCLKEGQGGEWRLTDASGSVTCECPSLSPLWLNCPIFLPHWNYIPHDASRQEDVGGFLELIGSPVLLCPGAEQGLAAAPGGEAELSQAVGVREAAGLLKHRVKGQRLSVYGQVGSVCPLLVVAGSTFFCFILTDESRSLPVLVKDSSRLSWSQRVCVGQSVCVTALRVCALRGWRGNNILCVTEHSQLHADYTHTQENTPTESLLVMSQPAEDDCEEAEPEEERVQSGVRMKQSRVINYQGMVTEVVSEGAGLYLLDGKVGLCVAYQPAVRRKLRVGDRVELHHVHFLYRSCPDFPPSMLCTCLRSSLKVTDFSRVGRSPPNTRCPGDGVLPRLLLQRNMGVSEYLWACHLSSQLAQSLVRGVWRQQCVCLLSWRLMETLRSPGAQGHRDIYSEMLDEPHTCPLTQYSMDSAAHQYLSVSELLEALQTDCWSSVSLSSLLPPDGSSLTTSQINGTLSWSCRTLSSDPQSGDSLRQRPLLLLGVLELPSQTTEHKHSLQLRDATGAVACVVTESDEDEGGQRASFNSAWIGCLVGVVQFTLVTERFLQSDFPSYQHLDQDRFITHKHCRVYLQFSLDHLHILSPSFTMEAHLRHKGAEPGEDLSARKQKVEDEDETTGRKRRRREEEEASSSPSQHCVSMVIRVEHKEGVAWRNTGMEMEDEKAGLRLCFSLRAAMTGPVVSWGRDPKNEPMTERERQEKEEQKVVLVFSGVCTRWFPVLQPGCFYRLVAANTQDPSILIGCGITGRSGVELHADSILQVRHDWRFHTLTRPLLLPTCRQVVPPTVLSVSEVLDCRSELVCFQGLVSERISLNNRTTDSGQTHSGQTHSGRNTSSGMRLTLCDKTGRSLQVYLDLSHTPYPPGLLPGNTLLLSGFQRKVSRTGSVYCTYLPVSSITVVSLGDTSSARPPPAPFMHLGQWTLSSEQRCTVGQVKGHMVCFLFLQLQWSCSLCGSVYTQCFEKAFCLLPNLPALCEKACSSSQCRSTSSVFQSKAKLVIDDGTGEAHVWFSGVLVRPLLGLADVQWEGLQRALRVRGHIRVYPRGQSQVCDGDSDDVLLHFLLCMCSSDVVSRPLSLTCRKHTNQRPQEVRKFTRGDRDFLTRLAPPLQLTCLHLHPD